ncbi:MAG TPA: hypothetical protein VHR65_07435 [Solirubrobacterales bacterium]|nr:hypothetical protein [Solirubrobacterales bacterium]
MGLKSKTVTSNEVRIPAPVQGTAMHVTRYGRDQSVILHPDDYHALGALDELVERACRVPPLKVSEAGYAAHMEEDRGRGEPIEDPVALRKLLG